MAAPTQEEIDAARKADLNGITSIRDAEQAITYDAKARAEGIVRAERRANRTPIVGYAKCSKGT